MKKAYLLCLLLALSLSAEEYRITLPGTYIISKDIDWQAGGPDRTLITIAASNVTLDGDGRTLRQMDTKFKHATGICIEEGVSDVTIQNLILSELSGGGILSFGNNERITVKGSTIANCGYSSLKEGFGIRFDGPIKDVQIVDCRFVEMGILRSVEPARYEKATVAIQASNGSNLLVKGSTIDGCVGRNSAQAIALTAISNAKISDVFITDIFSAKNAKGIVTDNVDGEVIDCHEASILSNIHPVRFGYYLDTHPSVKDDVPDDDGYVIEACHIKNVIPDHLENEPLLFQEHPWREFRTLGRLVAHNSHIKSKTSALYAKWVELFCKQVLGVEVRVVAGFANLYTHGDTPLPAHRDQYKKWVIGLSFGEMRTLDFVPDNPKKEILSYVMESGDIFLFAPDVNNHYQHRMLAEPEKTGRRINLSYFIDILPGQDCTKLLNPRAFTKEEIPTLQMTEALVD